MTKEQYLRRFTEITEEMFRITSIKNHDYSPGDEALANFNEFGAAGVLVRISDKTKRLKTAIWHKQNYLVNESVIDTVTDLAVYSIIMRILIEEEEKALKEKYPLIEVKNQTA
jgi:hypothetical protein